MIEKSPSPFKENREIFLFQSILSRTDHAVQQTITKALRHHSDGVYVAETAAALAGVYNAQTVVTR